MIRTKLLCCCFLFCIDAYAQKSDLPDDQPGARQHAIFIYHPQSKGLLLVDGYVTAPDSAQSDVWKWNGKKWTKITAFGPFPKTLSSGDINQSTGKIEIFGGWKKDFSSLSDTWVFDGHQWKEIKSNDIGTRDHHKMIYANHLNALVLYGGQNQKRDFDTTTWLYKNGQFTALNIPGPGIRYHFGLAYDRYREKIVLYGGGDRRDELWEFDGRAWMKIVTKENPGNRLRHSMVYSDDLRMIILQGGEKTNSDTWGWDGTSWKKIAEGGPNLQMMAMGYDPSRKTIVAYGGGDSNTFSLCLWELKDGKWKKILDNGVWSRADLLKQWIGNHPDDMIVRQRLATALRADKLWAEAEIEYKKIYQVQPENINILIELIAVLIIQDKSSESENYFHKAIHSSLMNADLYNRLGRFLIAARKHQEVPKYWEKALEMEPNGSDFYNLACVYALINEKDKAFENLNKAVEFGYNSKQQFGTDPDIESLRSDIRFNELLKKLK